MSRALQPSVMSWASNPGRSTPATKTCRRGPRLPWAGMTRAFGAGLLDCADGIAGKSEADFPGGNDSRKGNDNSKGKSRSFAALRMTSLWGWSQKGKSNFKCKSKSNCKNRCKGMGRLAFAVFHLCRKCWAKIGHSPPIFAGKENVQGVARIAFPECLKHYPE